ncbi:MAG: hypothetical protein M3Q89_01220 [Verrucomicrobiota bacterium]|nr:hypothetical protein [Verrucomicrobiota bacterium]
MEDILAQLAASLRGRLEIIGDEESRRDLPRHTARLQVISEQIEALVQRLPPKINPQLRHYLQRHSYSKALDFLSARAQDA